MVVLLELYAIRNSEGKWFAGRASGKYKLCWNDELSKSKIYPKKGTARTQITWMANNFKNEEIAKLVTLEVTNFKSIIETERVKKSQNNKQKNEIEHKKRHAIWRREAAEEEIKRAQKELTKLDNEEF